MEEEKHNQDRNNYKLHRFPLLLPKEKKTGWKTWETDSWALSVFYSPIPQPTRRRINRNKYCDHRRSVYSTIIRPSGKWRAATQQAAEMVVGKEKKKKKKN